MKDWSVIMPNHTRISNLANAFHAPTLATQVTLLANSVLEKY